MNQYISRPGWAAALLLVAVAVILLAFCSLGCCSSKPTFEAPEVRLTGVPIPVPPPALTCTQSPRLALAEVTRETVEADGSILVRACTQDILTLMALLEEYRDQCVDFNQARQLIVEAEREARRKLEAINNPP